jgi:hypothetical protein
LPLLVQIVRPLWIRDLRLYRTEVDNAWPSAGLDDATGRHVRSRFRSLSDPGSAALYSMRDGSGGHDAFDQPPPPGAKTHTLAVVREFRRVPLDASTLRLMLFVAGEGCAARVIGTLAHWAERAVSAYQPAYLLLAHSLEQPCISVLLAAVHEGRALAWARPFSVESILPDVRPWLEEEPERYVYWPEERRARRVRLLAPDAV